MSQRDGNGRIKKRTAKHSRHWRELHDQCSARKLYVGERTLADFTPRTVARLIRNGRKNEQR